MTSGQRIAQKRKELGLSQEGLGEQLGVSRQAIYKWESDASLPEIDKLITLSKIFSVSVGWLLGVEEETQPAQREDSGELTETQLQMVQEIVDRYQAARPEPRKSAWDKWSVRILFAMCGIMLALLVVANNKMKEMDHRYTDLANSIGEVSYSVNSQIGSITSRVENILKSQNSLTAEWSTQLASTDLQTNTATFDVRAVPKTYTQGMTAVFQARSGENIAELPVDPGTDGAFSGQITCPLTDEINLSVVFLIGDRRETQWLEDYYNLYSDSFPFLTLDSNLWFDERDDVLPAQLPADQSRGHFIRVRNEDSANYHLGWNPDPPTKLQVGLFKDQKLVMWYQGGVETVTWNGVPKEEYLWRRPEDVTLEPGFEYCEAAVYTDQYGRQRVYLGSAIMWNSSGDSAEAAVSVAPVAPSVSGGDPANWEF